MSTNNSITKQAAESWLKDRGFRYRCKGQWAGGFILFGLDNRPRNWFAELPNPREYQPGIHAINERGEIFVTTGGCCRDGALEWVGPVVTDGFPADFQQFPRFEVPIIAGGCVISRKVVDLGVLPSEQLVIVTQLPDQPLTSLVLMSDFILNHFQFDRRRLVLVWHNPAESGLFRLVLTGFSNEENHFQVIRLFRASGDQLTPAHLRQLVGMLPAIREVMAEGQGGGE